MKSHGITGGGSVQLHVLETGNPLARPILFIHGFSQCSLSWHRQLVSDLAVDFRLVAIDLRGHGRSDKPRGAYSDSKLWADDLNAVINTLRLENPLLCCWSYGLTLLDYIRHYGTDSIAAIHLVGAISKLGSDDALSVITPEALASVPGLFVTDVAESVRNLEAFIRMLYARPLSSEDLYMMLGYNVAVPPYVRQALFSRIVDNDDVLAKIRKPVLITHGKQDAVVKLDAVDRHKALMPHAEVDIMPTAGHAPFWDDAEAFNRRLRTFVDSL